VQRVGIGEPDRAGGEPSGHADGRQQAVVADRADLGIGRAANLVRKRTTAARSEVTIASSPAQCPLAIDHAVPDLETPAMAPTDLHTMYSSGGDRAVIEQWRIGRLAVGKRST